MIQFGERTKTKVKDIMTKPVVTVLPDEKVSNALEKTAELRIGRMPVLSKTGAWSVFWHLAILTKYQKFFDIGILIFRRAWSALIVARHYRLHSTALRSANIVGRP